MMPYRRPYGRISRSKRKFGKQPFKRTTKVKTEPGTSARVKFGSTKALNYKGVAYRKETVSAECRFSWVSGTGTSNGLYAHASFVTAAGPTNWNQIKQLWGQYQIRGFKIKLFSPFTNVEATSQGIYQTPTLWYKKDCVDSVNWASIDEANQAQAKMVRFTKPLSFYVPCKPEIELDTTGGVKIPVDHRKTWIPVDADSVKHRGIKFLLGDLDATEFGTSTMNVRCFITYYFGLKQQE